MFKENIYKMDIPTVKDQVAASQPEKKTTPNLVEESIEKSIKTLSHKNPSALLNFNVSINNDVILKLVHAGFSVYYTSSHLYNNEVVSVSSSLKITNPIFLLHKEEEDIKNNKDMGKAFGKLVMDLGAAETDPKNKVYYDMFSGFMNLDV